ncbi:flavin oxidoreductase [Prochlorothrix hollandica PCC 9006 = CALU 1027]|uniref:Flavin oxidoreductase n=1 Tax=Prochlorothrix hollandica PCC 9006 = CALU 1027 TaxID=317619 RepID=A0A0M2PWN0_PROHO|nr:flavin oxidoreductase [Prochlorothrix hollandica PCC 9006 = CALU 1027]
MRSSDAPAPESLQRDVQTAKLGSHTLALRSRSWNRLRFEMEYALERGTTANSYLIQGEKIALLDPPGESFTSIFLESLGQEVDYKDLDYVILGHINPNRAKTLQALLQKAPQITLVCSNPAAKVLETLYTETLGAELPGYTLQIQVIKGDDTLDLGRGHQLRFVPTPTPRWPGGLCTYDPATEIAFTDKFFSLHYCGDQVFDEEWLQFLEDYRYYFDCLMAPQLTQSMAAVDKIEALGSKIYAPGHGHIIRSGRRGLTDAYRQWSQVQQKQDLMVALLYASAYGSTATIAQAIAQGVTKAGVRVETLNCEMASPEELRSVADRCDGFIIGSPTLGGHAPTQIQTALGILLSTVPKTKPVGVFGSFGWSGEAIDLLEGKLKDAGYGFGFESIRVKFKPTDLTLKTCEEAGTDFAQGLKKAKKQAERKASGSLEDSQAAITEQAVGRILGSLCVLTAKKGEVTGGMLASWVSQATFSPPGLTVAVAKDRAVEGLAHTGDRFVLNVLAAGRDRELQKHFLKPFEPGADRFQGLDIDTASCGAPILREALAYLECRVANRMECGDHWVVYGVVEQGKLLDETSKTMVHYRKTGSRY